MKVALRTLATTCIAGEILLPFAFVQRVTIKGVQGWHVSRPLWAVVGLPICVDGKKTIRNTLPAWVNVSVALIALAILMRGAFEFWTVRGDPELISFTYLWEFAPPFVECLKMILPPGAMVTISTFFIWITR